MSTLQVANIWFESTGNNRIQYTGSNSYVIVAGGANTLTVNSTAATITGAATFSNTLTLPASGIKFSDNSTLTTAPLSGFSNMQVFTANGTFTVPAGVTKVKVTVVGGGGGGGGSTSSYGGYGGGGGGGGSAIKIISGLTPAGTVSVTVGAGGAASSGGAGGAGGTSSFGAYCSSTGGGGGVANYGDTGLGGSGSSGDLNIVGGSGGGGGGGTVSFGGSSFFGGSIRPAVPSNSGDVAGVAGCQYGGGGSGSRSPNNGSTVNGGAGASGVVVVEY